MAGIHVVATKRFARPKSRSLCIIGDPGCDGLSSYSMRVYEEALRCARPDELTLVAGDLVPAGEASYYETFRQVTDTFARGEVLVLRGNHDTGAYTDAFGSETYAVDCDGFTLIVLDNSARLFTEASLQLLRDVLPTVKRAVVAFHIPLPNPVCGNSVPESEAAKLLETIKPYRDRVAWFVCGHVHSRFVAACGGVPMVCTGGGGAFIEDVSPSIRATDVTHHVVRLEINNAGDIACDVIDLPPSEPTERGPILESSLRNVVSEELLAHLRYLFLAERAAGRGDKASAALLRDLAGFSAEDAWQTLRALLKDKYTTLRRVRPRFIKGALANPSFGPALSALRTLLPGFADEPSTPDPIPTAPKALVRRLWDDLLFFASTLYPKSHALARSLLYLRLHNTYKSTP